MRLFDDEYAVYQSASTPAEVGLLPWSLDAALDNAAACYHGPRLRQIREALEEFDDQVVRGKMSTYECWEHNEDGEVDLVCSHCVQMIDAQISTAATVCD